jgi:hypothetical protein
LTTTYTNIALKTLKMFLMPLCGGAAKPPRLVLNGFSAALQAALVSKADEPLKNARRFLMRE